MDFNYLYKCQQNRYDELEKNMLPLKEHLHSEIYENCYLLPIRFSNECMMGIGGVVDKSHHYIQSSATRSGGSVTQRPVSLDECTQYMGKGYEISTYKTLDFDEIIYLGNIYNHWGHFLIDFCTRLWYVCKYGKNKKCAFIVKEHEDFQLIPNIQRFMELIGIVPEDILFVNEVTKCKKVIIPEPSYCSNVYYSNEYLKMFDTIAVRIELKCTIKHDKVYFTRSQFKKAQGSEIGENILLDYFRKNGYYIASPELLSLDEQVALVRNCEILAGISGTLTHNFLFAKSGSSQKFIIINKTYILNIMQMDINQMKCLQASYIDAYLSPAPVSLGTGPFLFDYTRQFKKYVKNTKTKEPDEKYICSMARNKNMKAYL